MAILEQGLVDPAAEDAQDPAWPWRILVDIDGKNVLDDRDMGRLGQLLPQPWCGLHGGWAAQRRRPGSTGRAAWRPAVRSP